MSETQIFKVNPELARVLGDALRDMTEKKNPPPRPPAAEQLERLRAMQVDYNVARSLKRGDRVRTKPGLGNMNEATLETHPMILWRILDGDDPHDLAIIHYWTEKFHGERIDCLIGHLCTDGHCLVLVGADLHDLQPVD